MKLQVCRQPRACQLHCTCYDNRFLVSPCFFLNFCVCVCGGGVQYIFPVGCSCFPVIVDFILFIAAVFLWFVSLSLSFITSSANKQVSLYFPLIICLFPGVSQWFLHTILFYPVVLWLSVNIWSYLVVLPLGVTILSYLAVLALDVAILSYPVILLLAVT